MNNIILPNQDIITPDEFKQEHANPVTTGLNTKFTRSGSGLYVPVNLTKEKPL